MTIKSEKTYDLEIILNRKINYSIIRYYWDILKGFVKTRVNKKTNEMELGLYDIININKNKYDSIVNEGAEIDLDKVAVHIQSITGIDKKYFLGEKMLYIDGMEFALWKDYFQLNKLKKILKDTVPLEIKDVPEEYKKYMVDDKGLVNKAMSIENVDNEMNKFIYQLKNKLKKTNFSLNSNKEMFLLNYFIKNGDAFTTASRLDDFIRYIDKITITELSKIDTEKLNDYIETLKYQLLLAETVVATNRRKNKDKLQESK